MPEPDKTDMPLATKVYRMRLLEGIQREIDTRAASLNGEWTAEARNAAVDDMLLLKDDLPQLTSETRAKRIDQAIQASLDRCQSPLVRSIPVGNLRSYMMFAYQVSQKPYRPTPDELSFK